jgi:hypothetical protein
LVKTGEASTMPKTPGKFSKTWSHWTELTFDGIKDSRITAVSRRQASTIRAMHVMATFVAALTDRYWNPEVRHNMKIKSD